jgi:hypothetical protein
VSTPPIFVIEVDGCAIVENPEALDRRTVTDPLRPGFQYLIKFEPDVGDLLCWDGKYWKVVRYKGVEYPIEAQS